MRGALTDTHALLWTLNEDVRLSRTAKATFSSRSTTIYVSVVSLWEIAIKEGRGSLELTPPVKRLFEKGGFSEYGFVLLQVELAHLDVFRRLPPSSATHGDPFDRMLAAQARADGLELLSADAKMDAYGVQRVW